MIILRKLFSRRRNLTPEQERERKLRDRVYREEVSKSNTSHIITKSKKFRVDNTDENTPYEKKKDGIGVYTKFDTPRGKSDIQSEAKDIVQQGGGYTKEVKKRLRALGKGKSGVISLHPDAPLHVQIHEPGHPIAILNSTGKDKEDADQDEILSKYNDEIPKDLNEVDSRSKEELEDLQHRIQETGRSVVRREELANSEGRKMLERQGASKSELDKYDSGRKRETDTYREAADNYNKWMDLVMQNKKSRKK